MKFEGNHIQRSGSVESLVNGGKSGELYNPRAVHHLQRIFPETKHLPETEFEALFTIGDQVISVFQIYELSKQFPEYTAKQLSEFLHDESALLSYTETASQWPKTRQQKFWQLFASLPLPESVHKLIFEKFYDAKYHLGAENGLESTAEAMEATTLLPTRKLPFGDLPHADTFLRLGRSLGRVELPTATVLDTHGLIDEINLTQAETAAALVYVSQKLSYIRKHRDVYEKEYGEKHGLAEDANLSLDEIKKYALKKLLKKRVEQIIASKTSQSEHYIKEMNLDLEIRFRQYRHGMSPQVRKIISDTDTLKRLFEKHHKPDNNFVVGSREISAPEMIDLSEINHLLGENIFELKERPQTDGPVSYPEKITTRDKAHMNELQQVHGEITRATKSGDWERALNMYLKYLNFWPQYVQHRFGVLDIHERVLRGQLIDAPKKILSVASGPHEELRAQYDVSRARGLEMPTVVSFDITPKMLQESRASLPEEIKDAGQDLIGDMKDLPPELKDFEMVECSSFDNLKSEDEAKKFIVSALGTVGAGGLVRFSLNQPFTEQFCELLSRNGIEIVVNNTKPCLTKETKERIVSEKGQIVADRIDYKLKRHTYFLARVTPKLDLKSIERDMENTNLYIVSKQRTSWEVRDRLISGVEDGMTPEYLETCYTVAQWPIHFLEQKHLPPEYIREALTQVYNSETLDSFLAARLYKKYFSDERIEPFCDLVLKIVISTEAAKGIIPVSLLGHPNEGVRQIFKGFLIEHIPQYLSRILDADLDKEILIDVIRAIPDTIEVKRSLEALSERLLAADRQDDLLFLLSNLSGEMRLSLPVRMRFTENLKEAYFTHDVSLPIKERLSTLEMRRIIEGARDIEISREDVLACAKEATQVNNGKFALAILDYVELHQARFSFSNEDAVFAEFLNYVLSIDESMPMLSRLEKKFGLQINERRREKQAQIDLLHGYRSVERALTKKRIPKYDKEELMKNETEQLVQQYVEISGLTPAECYDLLLSGINNSQSDVSNRTFSLAARRHVETLLHNAVAHITECDTYERLRMLRKFSFDSDLGRYDPSIRGALIEATKITPEIFRDEEVTNKIERELCTYVLPDETLKHHPYISYLTEAVLKGNVKHLSRMVEDLLVFKNIADAIEKGATFDKERAVELIKNHPQIQAYVINKYEAYALDTKNNHAPWLGLVGELSDILPKELVLKLDFKKIVSGNKHDPDSVNILEKALQEFPELRDGDAYVDYVYLNIKNPLVEEILLPLLSGKQKSRISEKFLRDNFLVQYTKTGANLLKFNGNPEIFTLMNRLGLNRFSYSGIKKYSDSKRHFTEIRPLNAQIVLPKEEERGLRFRLLLKDYMALALLPPNDRDQKLEGELVLRDNIKIESAPSDWHDVRNLYDTFIEKALAGYQEHEKEFLAGSKISVEAGFSISDKEILEKKLFSVLSKPDFIKTKIKPFRASDGLPVQHVNEVTAKELLSIVDSYYVEKRAELQRQREIPTWPTRKGLINMAQRMGISVGDFNKLKGLVLENNPKMKGVYRNVEVFSPQIVDKVIELLKSANK